MKLLATGTNKPKYDTWGFPHIWLPFGKAGNIYRQDGTVAYSVLEEDILNPLSIETLAGLPLYEYHPVPIEQGGIVNLDNFNNLKQVGITTDTYRLCDNGGEVLCKITDKSCANKIGTELVECSPGYSNSAGTRTYNHFAILPSGKARGGSKMKIKLEGFTGVDLPEENQEFYTLDKSANFNLTDETIIDEETLTIIKNIMTTEELIGQVLANQVMANENILGIKAQVESLLASEKSEVLLEGEAETKEPDAVYLEGFTAGQEAGKTIATATEYGFTGTTVAEAESHLITKAFPEMKLEGFSPDVLKGVLKGATEALKSAKSTVAVVAAQVEKVPAVVENLATGKGASGRIKLSTATLG
jgi:hypothetical protein